METFSNLQSSTVITLHMFQFFLHLRGVGESMQFDGAELVLDDGLVLELKVGASVLTGQVEHVSLQTSRAGK